MDELHGVRRVDLFPQALDGDGQNDPADLPALLDQLSIADLVAGVRVNRQDSWLRRTMSRLANAIRSRLLGDGARDAGCALKAFRREVREAFVPIRTLYSFTPALAAAAGFRVIEWEVQHRPRTHGASKYGLGVMLWRPLADMLGVWITAALACLVQVSRGGPALWRWAYFAAMGFGFLTKGPMALVVPISGARGMRLAMSRHGLQLPLPWGRGLLLTLALGLSWFIALALTSQELLHYFWHDELLARFASRSHGRSEVFWFFVPVIVGGFLPWTWFLPGLLRDGWQRLRSGRPLSPLHGQLLGWLFPPFVILSISGAKLSTYVLPLFPALALLFAWWWQRKGLRLRRVAVCSSVAVATYLALCSQLPRFNDLFAQQASIRPLVEVLRRQPGLHVATVFACNVRVHGLEFYLGAPVAVTRREADLVLPTTPAQEARLFDSAPACELALSQRPVAYGVLRAKDAGRFFPPDRWRVLARAGSCVLIGRASGPRQDEKE